MTEISNDINIDDEYQFNILVIGYEKTGKTSIVNRYFKDEFTVESGFDFYKKVIIRNNKQYIIKIWDLNNYRNKKHFEIAPSVFMNKVGFMIVYDIVNQQPNSIEALQYNLNEIKRKSRIENPSIVIVGNKSDLLNDDEDHQIKLTIQATKNYCDSISIKSFQVSAMNSLNINDSFNCLINDIFEKNHQPIIYNSNQQLVALKKYEAYLETKKTNKSKCVVC